MNPRERYLAAVRGEPVDRVPVHLEGIPPESREDLERIEDPARRELAERIFDEHAATWNVPTYINRHFLTPRQRMHEVRREETAAGVVVTTEIATPRGPLAAIAGTNPQTRTTWQIKYPCESLDDIARIMSVRWEIPEGLAPPDMSRAPDDLRERRIVRAGISSPFVCAAGMVSYQYYLELCATERDLVREMTAECERRVLDVLEVILAEGTVEYVWMGGSEWLTPPMASPDIYEEFVQGPESRVIEKCHAAGALVHVHCHGNVRSTIERVVARGGDFFEPVEPPPDGDITLAEAKAIVAGRMTLGGNIEARLLETRPMEEVEAACRAAFEGGKRRLVLRTTAGPISRINALTLRNYHKMIDVWEELSPLG